MQVLVLQNKRKLDELKFEQFSTITAIPIPVKPRVKSAKACAHIITKHDACTTHARCIHDTCKAVVMWNVESTQLQECWDIYSESLDCVHGSNAGQLPTELAHTDGGTFEMWLKPCLVKSEGIPAIYPRA